MLALENGIMLFMLAIVDILAPEINVIIGGCRLNQ